MFPLPVPCLSLPCLLPSAFPKVFAQVSCAEEGFLRVFGFCFCLLFPGGSDGKASAHNEGDLGSVPGSGRSSGEGNGNPLLYSCLENPMDVGAWWAAVHGVSKNQTRLSDFTFTFVSYKMQRRTQTVLGWLQYRTVMTLSALEGAEGVC